MTDIADLQERAAGQLLDDLERFVLRQEVPPGFRSAKDIYTDLTAKGYNISYDTVRCRLIRGAQVGDIETMRIGKYVYYRIKISMPSETIG